MWYNNGIVEIHLSVDSNPPEGYARGRLKRKTLLDKCIEEYEKEHSKEDLISYYSCHNASDTMQIFNIQSAKLLRGLCSYYGYKKSKPTMPKQATRDHASYLLGGIKSRETQKANWCNKTEEEKRLWSNKMKESHSTSSFKIAIADINSEYRKKLSPDIEAYTNIKRSNSLRKYWSNLTDEQRSAELDKRFGSTGDYSGKHSKPNENFARLLDEHNITYDREFRLGSYSYDFKINDILIEINPSITHNVTLSPFGKIISKDYHKNKSELATKHGYRCIHVWDWDDITKIIKLLLPKPRIYARNCEVKLVPKKEAVKFIDEIHLQNYAKSTINLGLYYNNELVSIMTFGKPRYSKNFDYELIRYCSSAEVIGGPNKLFSHFVKDYSPKSVVSYCDLSKFTGKLYKELGFTEKRVSMSKHWYNSKNKVHITDNLLRQQGFDRLFGTEFGKYTSNEELMLSHNFIEIYDSGQVTFELNF